MRLVNRHGAAGSSGTRSGAGRSSSSAAPGRSSTTTYRGTPPGTCRTASSRPTTPTTSSSRQQPRQAGRAERQDLAVPGPRPAAGPTTGSRATSSRAIGPRDDDTIPWTEHARDHPDRVLPAPVRGQAGRRLGRRPGRPGPPDRSASRSARGDAVAILAGPHAGQWRKIAQAIDPTTFLLDAPFPREPRPSRSPAGSSTPSSRGTSIDSRGSTQGGQPRRCRATSSGSASLNNRVLGGGDSFQIIACATEVAAIWGWSHAPFFGGLLEGNTFEDADHGGQIMGRARGHDQVEQGPGLHDHQPCGTTRSAGPSRS